MIEDMRNKVRKQYDRVAKGYVKRYRGIKGVYFKCLESDHVLDLADFREKMILDLGTGTGRLALLISELANKVVGVDISQNMVKVAKSDKSRANVNFLLADALSLCFAAGSFDICTCLGMFEYVNDLSPFLKEIKRVLKPEGLLIFSCHNKRKLFPRKTLQKLYPRIAEHSLQQIQEQLNNADFQLIHHKGTFYIPPNWVWTGYKLFYPLKNIWIKLVIRLNKTIENSVKKSDGKVTDFCSELIISAKVTKDG